MPHDGRLPLEQRRSVLEHDPLVSSYVDNKVWCTACHKSIAVSKSMELSNWNRHCKRRHGRTEEDIAAIRASALTLSNAAHEHLGDTSADESDGADELDVIDRAPNVLPAPPASRAAEPLSTQVKTRSPDHDQRWWFLQNDPLVEEAEPTRVLCKPCRVWIKLQDKSVYCLSHWHDHCRRKHARSSAVLAGLLDVALGNQTATLPTSEQNLDKEDKSTSAEDDEEDRLPSNDHDSRKVESGSGWSAFTVAFINRDPLADHLNIKDKTVHCVECNRSFVQSSTSNIGNWHRHCASSAHRRTPNQRLEIEQQARTALAGSSSTTNDSSSAKPTEEAKSPEEDDLSKESSPGLPSAFLELDPLVAEYQSDRVRCKECDKWIRIESLQSLRHWHEHCGNRLHKRSQAELQRMIRESDASSSHDCSRTTSPSTQQQDPTVVPSVDGLVSPSKSVSAVRYLTRRVVADNQNLEETDESRTAISYDNAMELDEQACSTPQRDVGPTLKSPNRPASLSAFSADDLELHQRFLRYDALAKKLDIGTGHVHCAACSKVISVRLKERSCSFKYWNMHCTKHGRKPCDAEKIMKLVISGSLAPEPRPYSPTRPQKRMAEAEVVEAPPNKRQRVADPVDDNHSMVEVDPNTAIRARSGHLSQCNGCGSWIRHANFERHFNDRCPKRILHGAPALSSSSHVSRATSSTLVDSMSETLVIAPHCIMLAAPPSSGPCTITAQSHNLSDYAGQAASHHAKTQAAFLFFLWTHNTLAKIAYMQRQQELGAAAETNPRY